MNSIIGFFQMLERMLFWGWHMRHSYDFDCHTIYKILHLKFKRTIKNFNEDGHCVWNDNPDGKQMKKLRTASELANRLNKGNGDYIIKAINEHEKKWGKSNHIWKELDNGCSTLSVEWPKAPTPEKQLECKKDYRRTLIKYDNIQRADKKLFFKLLERNLEDWWD